VDLSQSCSIDQVLLVSLASSHSERSSMSRNCGSGRLTSGVFSSTVTRVIAGWAFIVVALVMSTPRKVAVKKALKKRINYI